LPDAIERTRDGYRISTGPALLDLDVMHAFLRESYWAPGYPRNILERAVANSLNFGLYTDGAQIGFARVCTDRATFAYLMDVFVLPDHRGKGLSVWLMETVMSHPDLQSLASVPARDA
jgi:GNAT superfamily N-acetyltransferase